MNTRSPSMLFTGLLLLACIFIASCSTDPQIPAEAVTVQEVQEPTKSLQDTVVASEDEVLTWDESADKKKPSPQKTDTDQ